MAYRILRIVRFPGCLITVLLAASQVNAVPPVKSAAPARFPGPEKVQKIVSDYLDSLDRGEMDLLSRRDVSPLMDVLEDIGWDMTQQMQAEFENQLLKDSDWLVRTLRTRKGTRFMRDMSSFPGGYDRLDRMRQQPHGKKQLLGLINSPGGAELIEYLTTTKQGRRTGAQLSSPRGGGKFNTPTNRLYTKADVVMQVKRLYAAEAAQRLQATSVITGRSVKSKSVRSQPPRESRPRQSQSPEESSSSPIED